MFVSKITDETAQIDALGMKMVNQEGSFWEDAKGLSLGSF